MIRYNGLIITKEEIINNHPMLRDEQMDYNFQQAEDNYEEWLFSGGELFREDTTEYDVIYRYTEEELHEYDEFPF